MSLSRKQITIKINDSILAVLRTHVQEYGNTLISSAKMGDEWVQVNFIKEKVKSGWTFYGDGEE